MAHKEHKQFNETVFKQLCNEAGKDLPEILAATDWETKQVAVLEHLLARVRDFCGINEGFKFADLTGYPRSIQLKQEIIGIVDFDSVHEHPTSVFFYMKRKGYAIVRLFDDSIHEAEVHWYEAQGIGKKEIKIKRLLD